MTTGHRHTGPWRNLALAALLIPCVAHTQGTVRDPTIENLPRPGYEPRTIRTGNLVIAPALALNAAVTDNVFALLRTRKSDTLFTIRPDVVARYRSSALDMRATAYANLYRYARFDAENVNEYGGAIAATRTLGSRHSLTARAGYDRTFERRSDPEADLGRARRPALIDIFDGGLDYRYKGSKIGIVANVGATKLDYLPLADSDRDLVIYRGSLRGTVPLTGRMGVFVQGYANRRDTQVATDRGGIDRQTTTIGVITGVSFDLADRLQGEIGGGVLRENPEDIGIPPYTGFAASGRLVWRPRVRTAVVIDGFRGDVATVRIGAIGRIDTRISVSVDQEARHNVLLHAAAGMRYIRFRGAFDQNQRYWTGEVEGRYLFNRHLSAIANIGYMRRDTDTDFSRFQRWQGTLGLRYAY